MKTKFKVGQKVWDNALGFGEGEVINPKGANALYPIDIKFKYGIEKYTTDGRYSRTYRPTLFTTPYTLFGFSQEPVKEESFLTNRWYKQGNFYGFFIKKGIENKGFLKGQWNENIGMLYVNDWQLIDDSNGAELKDLLTKEAIRMGFVKGAKIVKTGFNSEYYHINERLITGEYVFNENLTICANKGGFGDIFNNGLWAEIE